MTEVIKIEDQNELVPTSIYPHAKWKFENFNPVQSRLIDIYNGDANVTIAAATAAGKTISSEIFAAYEIRKNKKKMLYIGPLKSLVKEKYQDWTKSDYHFSDLKTSICSGDYRLTNNRIKELEAADIIIMTPEMLASRCRNHKSEKSQFLHHIGCVVFDESHLLGVPGRGDHIEVALMKLCEINPNCRVILLSATLPNVPEVCQWVSKLTNRNTYYLESKYRPCPLHIHYEKYYDGGKKYEDKENEKVGSAVGIVNYYSEDKFLVFVHTKRTGQLVLAALKRAGIDSEFHNADLDAAKRDALERKFKEDPKFRCVVATSTLAWGCHKKGSLVLMSDGSFSKVEKIRPGDYVASLKNGRIVAGLVTRVGEPKPKDYSVEVVTETGHTAVVSPDHKFLGTSGRQSPDWVVAEQIQIGDYIAISHNVNLRTSVESDDLGYLTGYVLGDGCIVKKSRKLSDKRHVLDIAFGDEYRDFIPYIQELLTRYSCYTLPPARQGRDGVWHLVCGSTAVIGLFPHIPRGRKASKLTLECYNLSDGAFVRGLLQGLFDADGGFSSHGNGNISIEYNTVSLLLAEQVRCLLEGFGINCSIGKKKMTDSVINGRLQVARRKYIYRVRVYHSSVPEFINKIGFRNPEKAKYAAYFLENFNTEKPLKDIIPVRQKWFENHADVVGHDCKEMLSSVGIDYWSAFNKQDVTRAKLLKLLSKYPGDSELSQCVTGQMRFTKVKSVQRLPVVEMFDIEVEDTHNYICSGFISHNCNLPARRVVIVGVDRGLQPVENYDIWQMAGRAGRPAYDPRGDVYILVPESQEKDVIARFNKKNPIRSQLLDDVGGHHKTLAFHIVSEIHHGNVKTKEGFHEWFKRSFASHQNQDFSDAELDRLIDLLVKCKAVTSENGEYKVTTVGTVASMFYFSPFDVADLKNNFKKLFENHWEKDDYRLAVALADIDDNRFGIVNKSERIEMLKFQIHIEKLYGKGTIKESAIKVAFGYYNLITGQDNPVFGALQAGLRADSERTIEVLNAIDSMSARWSESDYFNTIRMRLTYGVRAELVDLCRIPNIGKVRAERLFTAGVRNMSDFVATSPDKLSLAMNLTVEKAKEAQDAARGIKLKDMMG